MSAYAQGLFGNGQGPALPLPPNTWHGSCCPLQMQEAVMKISKLHKFREIKADPGTTLYFEEIPHVQESSDHRL
jgi:hypothetical protein